MQEDRAMNMQISRRQLMVGAAVGAAGTTLVSLIYDLTLG